MHWEQSSVGNVSESPAILPPTDGSFSTSTTSCPAEAMSSAAWMPATPFRDGNRDRHERVIVFHFFDAHADQLDGLPGRLVPVRVDPGAVLADVGHLDQVGIDPGLFRGLAEGLQVHVRRAGSDDDGGEAELLDFLQNHLLPRFGAHVLVIDGTINTADAGDLFGDLFAVDRPGDVLAAPTSKNADFHGRLWLVGYCVCVVFSIRNKNSRFGFSASRSHSFVHFISAITFFL